EQQSFENAQFLGALGLLGLIPVADDHSHLCYLAHQMPLLTHSPRPAQRRSRPAARGRARKAARTPHADSLRGGLRARAQAWRRSSKPAPSAAAMARPDTDRAGSSRTKRQSAARWPRARRRATRRCAWAYAQKSAPGSAAAPRRPTADRTASPSIAAV